MPLWEAFFEAGKDLNVRAGCPNLIERIEGGLLSFGSDMTRQNTPVEAGLAKFCNAPDEYLGKSIIEKQKRKGQTVLSDRSQLVVMMTCRTIQVDGKFYPTISKLV
jgi:glycine cleavage system aminomethyltransferase T